MTREKFAEIIFNEGIYYEKDSKSDEDFVFLNILENNKNMIFMGRGKSLFRADTFRFVGIYSKEHNALIDATRLVELFKQTVKEEKKINPKNKPLCLVTTKSEIRKFIEEAVNEKVEEFIKNKYSDTVIDDTIKQSDVEYLKRLGQREDIKRYLEYGNKEIPYAGSFSVPYTFNYDRALKYLENQEAVIEEYYQAYIQNNEYKEHLEYLASHVQNCAIKQLHAKEDHPVHVKRVIYHYTHSKRDKDVLVELNSDYKDEDDKPFVLTVNSSIFGNVYSLEGMRLNELRYEDRKRFKELFPDTEVIPYKDIKKITNGQKVVYQDYLIV